MTKRAGRVAVPVFLAVLLTACASNDNAGNSSASDVSSAPQDTYHGYVIAKDDTLYFSSEAAYCERNLAYAHRLVDVVQHDDPAAHPDPDGVASLHAGTRLSVVGHLHVHCSFDSDGYGSLAAQTTKMCPDLTRVAIQDGTADQNGQTGYIVEGSLAKK
jgi:hypothetical protein